MNHAIRPFQSSDISAVVRVLNAALHADAVAEPRFVRQVLLDPNFRADGAPVAILDGQPAGFCLSIARQVPLENAAPDSERGYITLIAVAPPHQRRGIGSALLAHTESYLRDQKKSLVMISPYAPGYFLPGIDVAAYAPALKFFARHGYEEVNRPIAMQTSLWDWSVPDWVGEKENLLLAQGVGIEPFKPELTLPLLEFARRQFPGDWVRVVRETVARILDGDPPSRLIAAVENDQVLGFSHFDRERFGPIGVAPAQRGRFIGQVLMFHTLVAQRQQGFRVAWFLWSDDKTATRLYNSAGFKEVRRFALLRKPLGK